MSHFTTINTQVKDISALRSAVEEMGLPLLENTRARATASRGNTSSGSKPYDIALNKQPDGIYGLTCDWWQGHVKEVGPS